MRSVANRDEEYCNTVVANGGYASTRRLYYYTKYMLGDVSGVSKALEIGGGVGILSFYLASQGVDDVVCLEPEADGSTQGITNLFHKLQTALPCGERVQLSTTFFQDFDTQGETLDLIVSVNSVNHLNEDACVDIQTNRTSHETYLRYFESMFQMLRSGGRLIIADCSRYNYFNTMGITNPLMPTIEWNKHQSPYKWSSMLREAGFVRPKIQWTSYNVLGPWGRLIMGNPIASYFTLSHFKLTMWKP